MTSQSATSGTPRETVFDVDVERLAKVYAEAVLNAAGDQQDGVMEELRALVEMLDKHAGIEDVFGSALVASEEKVEMLDRLFAGRLSDTTLSFLKIMNKHDRLGFLRPVVRSADLLWSKRRGREPVELQLAHEIDGSLMQELLASLGSSLGVEPVVTTKIDPDLLAGFVVRMGDRVYDASARTRLERTRHAMIERSVEAIQAQRDRFLSE